MARQIHDDKSEHCIPFILERLKDHRHAFERNGKTPAPFFIGLNGVQGAGKTTLVSALQSTLTSSPHNLPVVVLSIDDLYLPHDKQVALAEAHPDNPLIQHRGEPSTHDVKIGVDLFGSLASRADNIKVPSYDKSRFDGAGDRRPQDEWPVVNVPGQAKIEVVIFEGWCVAFRALDDETLAMKWQSASEEVESNGSAYVGQLGRLKLDHVKLVNDKLRDYDELTDRLDAFIHIDAQDTTYVYDWRQEQEALMREEKGTGMTVEQVTTFVNGYYPAYELYTENLRKGIFKEDKGKQLRLVVSRDRRVRDVHLI